MLVIWNFGFDVVLGLFDRIQLLSLGGFPTNATWYHHLELESRIFSWPHFSKIFTNNEAFYAQRSCDLLRQKLCLHTRTDLIVSRQWIPNGKQKIESNRSQISYFERQIWFSCSRKWRGAFQASDDAPICFHLPTICSWIEVGRCRRLHQQTDEYLQWDELRIEFH